MRSSFPWPDEPPAEWHRRAYADAATLPFWLDSPLRPAPADPPLGDAECDLAIVGGGLSGLWAAVLAKERDPGRDVILLEGAELAHAASGRNGGFFSSSLTHGAGNGLARFPEEMPELERLGLENFEAVAATIERHGIECGLERNGDIAVALEPHEEAWLIEDADGLTRLGHRAELLSMEAMRAELDSPTYLGGMWQRSGSGLLDPARLCWGLARVAGELGVRVHERSWVERLASRDGGVELRMSSARVRADRVLLATSAYPGLVGAIRRRVIPVWDYVLVTEPLDAARRASLGWERRQGISDSANLFHYYRLTEDDRVLWGGYDAVYNYGNGIGPELEQREESFARLSQHLFHTFPQLEGIRFTHRWGGAIDTCSRFFAFAGTAMGGRVAYTVGHTGLGIGASRFGAGLALDLLDGRDSEATRLRSMRSRPLPFPPEPLRWAAVQLTRNRLEAADRRAGRRGLWLRALDRLGLGFDS